MCSVPHLHAAALRAGEGQAKTEMKGPVKEDKPKTHTPAHRLDSTHTP